MTSFKPWEIPTRAKPSPESETAAVEWGEIIAAQLRGASEYQSPFDPDVNLDDPKRVWWLHRRDLGEGRTLYLEPMLEGTLSLTIAPNKWTISDRYFYQDADAAWRAVLGWNGKGDPEGWVRHSPSMRRRRDGLIENEYINASER